MTAPTFVFKLELRGTSRLKRNVLSGCSALSDGKTMRIAQIAPLAESVPPKLYGGTERVVSWLTEELVSLGHDVTLFATGDSVTSAELVPVSPRALRLSRPPPDPAIATAALLEAVADAASRFDVIHSHLDWVHLPLLRCLRVPFLTTLHGRLDLPNIDGPAISKCPVRLDLPEPAYDIRIRTTGTLQ
jgi:glycosyltransferase involved in cell wall biosynthesis